MPFYYKSRCGIHNQRECFMVFTNQFEVVPTEKMAQDAIKNFYNNIHAKEIKETVNLITQYLGCGDKMCMFVNTEKYKTSKRCTCINHAGSKPYIASALSNLFTKCKNMFRS